MSKNNIESKSSQVSKAEAQSQSSRRKVLRSTLLGGAVIGAASVPDKWSKPVLDSVLLPAHASTTTDGSDSSGGGTPTTTAAPTTTAQATTTPAPTTTVSKKKLLGINFEQLDYEVS